MRGSDRLRENIAALYSSPVVTKDSILTTNGGIVANQIVLQALLSPDDHAIVMYPTYEQLYQTPRMLGAEVTLWKLEPSGNRWSLDFDFLRSSIKENTKMIVLNSPNNPTGAHLPAGMQQDIIDIARENDLIIFCDEVFYPLFRLDVISFDKEGIIGSLRKSPVYTCPFVSAQLNCSQNGKSGLF